MKATARRTTTPTAIALVAGAAVVLTLRPAVIASSPMPERDRAVLLALVYASIAAAALLPALPREAGPLPPLLVLGVGLAAGALAWSWAGPVAPLAISAVTLPLSLAAAIAEEALLRRLAYGHLRRFGVAAAIGLTAVLFAAIHVPSYGVAAVPVDLGAGLLFGWQRFASGTWTVPAATHAAANLLAVLR